MLHRFSLRIALAAACLCAVAHAAHAAIVVPGADGSDGIFQPQANVVIDLSQAATVSWDTPSPVAGKGVYDSEKWAVVFKYQRVNIPAGVTVTFKNHPSGAPVVWLVAENVVISGSVVLDGSDGYQEGGSRSLAEGGPGGFRGGYGAAILNGSGGFGPGGGYYDGDSGGSSGIFATEVPGNLQPPTTRVYGNARLLPLIGGSGGAGADFNDTLIRSGGGAGAGAILIATQDRLTLNGMLTATAGVGGQYAGPGSGGGIRIISDTVTGSGSVRAMSESTAVGRIRVEANSISLSTPGEPLFTAGYPGETAQIWPNEDAPSVRMVSLGGVPIPSDPRSNLIDFSQADVPVATADSAELVIETTNVATNADVQVRVTPLSGSNDDYPAFYVSTIGEISTWTVDLPLAQGFSALQVRVVTP